MCNNVQVGLDLDQAGRIVDHIVVGIAGVEDMAPVSVQAMQFRSADLRPYAFFSEPLYMRRGQITRRKRRSRPQAQSIYRCVTIQSRDIAQIDHRRKLFA